MTWDVVRKHVMPSRAAVTLAVNGSRKGRALEIRLSVEAVRRLGWQAPRPVLLLRGSGEDAGRLALRPCDPAADEARTMTAAGGSKREAGMALKVTLSAVAPGIALDSRPAEPAVSEEVAGMVVITLPDWLGGASPSVTASASEAVQGPEGVAPGLPRRAAPRNDGEPKDGGRALLRAQPAARNEPQRLPPEPRPKGPALPPDAPVRRFERGVTLQAAIEEYSRETGKTVRRRPGSWVVGSRTLKPAQFLGQLDAWRRERGLEPLRAAAHEGAEA